MRRLVGYAILLVLIGLLLSLPAASALAGGGLDGSLRFTYWPTSVKATQSSSQFANWSTGFFGLQLRAKIPNSTLSFNTEYLTGGQSGQGGTWVGSSGSDKVFKSYLSFPLINGNGDGFKLAGDAGWGKMGWNTDFGGGSRESFRSKGFMLGLYAQAMISPALSTYAKVSYYPFNAVTVANGTSNSSTSTATDWYAGVRYRTTVGSFDFGYRSITANAGNNAGCNACTFNWQGWYARFGITF